MPSSWLNGPHFQQELDCACVAACARMVLAHSGDVRSEADLRTLLDITSAVNLLTNEEEAIKPSSPRRGDLSSFMSNFPTGVIRSHWQ